MIQRVKTPKSQRIKISNSAFVKVRSVQIAKNQYLSKNKRQVDGLFTQESETHLSKIPF